MGDQFVLLVQTTVRFPKLILSILIVRQGEGKYGNYMYDKVGDILEPCVNAMHFNVSEIFNVVRNNMYTIHYKL